MTSLVSRLVRHVLVFVAVLVVLVLCLRVWAGVRSGQKMEQALARAAENWGAAGEDSGEPSRVPREENAAVALRGALAAQEDLPASALAAINRLKSGRDDVLVAREDLQAAVDSNGDALVLLDDALSRPMIDWRAEPPPGSQQPAGSPPVTLLIALSTTNWASGMLAVAAEEPGAALAAIRRQLLLARSLEDQPELMSQVVRLRLLSEALDLVRGSLAVTTTDEDVLGQVAEALQDLRGGEILQQAMMTDFEKMIRHHLDLDESGRANESAVLRWLYRPILQSRLAHEIEAFDALLAVVGTPRFARDEEGESVSRLPSGSSRWPSKLFPDTNLGEQLLDMADLVDARLVLARTAVALCRQKNLTGVYPESLPAGPQDPLTGEPLLYETVGGGFLLESARLDFEVQVSRNEPWGQAGLLSWHIPG